MKHFYMKQKVFSFRDRYKIFDEEQNVVFHCEGKLFSLSRKMKMIEDATDQAIYHFRKRIISFLPVYYLYDSTEKQVAVIKRRFSFRPKVEIESDFGNYMIDGDYFGHNFTLFEDEKEVASVTKKWVSWGDSYEIAIQNESKSQFLVALIILIDRIFHESKGNNSR